MLNYEFKNIPCSIGAILNSKEETARNMKMDWKTMNYLNGQKTKNNMENKNYCPNKKFTSCKFEYNFNKIIELSENIC